MKINERHEIHGSKVVLIPYVKQLVPKYHDWMKNTELLETTASEPLTLAEEYEMQESWRADEDKLTFIITDKDKIEEGDVEAMIGDINLFLLENNVGELMVMVAESNYRRRGFATEALLLMLRYCVEIVDIKEFVAKINADNSASVELFKKLGFEFHSRSDVFQHVCYSKTVTEEWIAWLESNAAYYTLKERTH